MEGNTFAGIWNCNSGNFYILDLELPGRNLVNLRTNWSRPIGRHNFPFIALRHVDGFCIRFISAKQRVRF